MRQLPFDVELDLPGVKARAIVGAFGDGVFTIHLTPTDADALGVFPSFDFTTTPGKSWIEARYQDRLALERHDEPGDPERQAVAHEHALAHPADAALDLLLLALLTDERE